MEYRYIDSSLGLHDGYDQTSMYSNTFNDEFIQVSMLNVSYYLLITCYCVSKLVMTSRVSILQMLKFK